MGRKPCCAKQGLNRGAWSAREDKILTNYIKIHGEGKWRDLPQSAGMYSHHSVSVSVSVVSFCFIFYSCFTFMACLQGSSDAGKVAGSDG